VNEINHLQLNAKKCWCFRSTLLAHVSVWCHQTNFLVHSKIKKVLEGLLWNLWVLCGTKRFFQGSKSSKWFYMEQKGSIWGYKVQWTTQRFLKVGQVLSGTKRFIQGTKRFNLGT
jgi:hypothetical protein